MNIIRILVCMSDVLLSAGLMTVLTHEPDLKVELCTSSDPRVLVEAFNRIRPQVVVLDQGSHAARKTIMIQVSDRKLDVHMILINEDDNWLHSIRHHRHQIRAASDLVSVIHMP